MGGLPQLQWVWRRTGTYQEGGHTSPVSPLSWMEPCRDAARGEEMGGPFSSPPTPLPLTWHLLWADGNSVSEEAERGPCSRLGRGGGHPAVPPPSACAEGLSCPGPQHSWDELGRSQPIPGGGSQQRKATTLNPPICPPALLPDTFHLCLNPAWLRNPRTSLERQGGPSWGSPSPNPSADPIPASVSPLGV